MKVEAGKLPGTAERNSNDRAEANVGYNQSVNKCAHLCPGTVFPEMGRNQLATSIS